MNSSTLRSVFGNLLRRNHKTLKTRLLVQKYRQYSQASDSVEYIKLTMQGSTVKDYQAMKTKRKAIPGQANGGNVTLSVLGSGGYGASRCIFLTTNYRNYVFNCGEGMQRLSQEHRIKLARVEKVFVTSCKWENIGGLIGLGLTIETIGASPLEIHGPKALATIMKSSKEFQKITHLKLDFVNYDEHKVYDNAVMSTWNVPIKPNVTSAIESKENKVQRIDDEDTETADKSNGKRTMATDYEPRKLLKMDCAEDEEVLKEVVCYVCKLHDRPGTLNLEKCVDFGVKPGPLLGKLKHGEDVTLEDGTVVRSADVCTVKATGPIFLVVDVPSESYLESFLNEEKFKEYQNIRDNRQSVAYIFHFTPREIVNDPRYTDWMVKFGPKTEHVVLDENVYTISSEAVMKNQYMLNLIHPKIFPHLPNGEGKNKEQDKDINITDKEGNRLKVYIPNALDVFYLYPNVSRDTTQNVKLTPDEYVDQCFKIDGFSDILTDVQRNVDARTKALLGRCAEYPKVVMLGTGCSVPCKYRNTSGILLQTHENNNILMDCGEGIHGQIQRRYNKSEYESILKNMKGIFISHLHADHHLGLFSILLKRAELTNDFIYIVAPEHYWVWMKTYHRNAERILDSVRFFSSETMNIKNYCMHVEEKTKLCEYLKINELYTTKVRHSGSAFGVMMTLNTGEKITYSGDTMPTPNLISLGANSNLLIHEATMDDTLVTLAKKAQHTTITEAIEVGRQMNAKFTLLTHFSQRYAKVPYIPGGVNASGMETVGLAYDFMEISISQLSLLPLFYPALLKIFAEHVEENEIRVAKKLQKINGNDMLANRSEL